MIAFTIPYPPNKTQFLHEYGLNSFYAGKHWAVRKRLVDSWHWTVRQALGRVKLPRKPLAKPVRITFFWNDRLDIDNHAVIAKCTVDALKDILLPDDNPAHFRAVSHEFWNRACIGVQIEEIG